jgi:mono/diheme cytochrome c family protein
MSQRPTQPLLLACALAIGFAACGGDVPSDPTWFADVQPIVMANCARCHGADPSDTRIAKFRLDRYVKDDAATFDAYDYAQATGGAPAPMVSVAVDQEVPAMPPDYALSDRQREILSRWVDQGAPKGTRANRLPQIALLAQAPEVPDQLLDLKIRSWDDDRDGLAVALWAHDLATAGEDQDVPLGPALGGGDREVTIDTGQLASKHTFEIYAVVDDGFFDEPAQNRMHVTLIPSVLLDHGARGTAPAVTLVSPNGGETLIGSATITWTATDPDAGDTVTIDLSLIEVAADGTERVAATIATGLPNTGSYAWMVPAQLPDGTYRIRVTGTDALGMPPNVRSDDSDDTLTIAQATTTSYTWADVQPIFNTYCAECHGDPARTVAINYVCLLQYQLGEAVPPCGASDQGVFEIKGLVYNRLVAQQTMPPAASPQPSQADLDKVGNWIQGGAPYGNGPANNLPTFLWMLPSATQPSGSTATLTWTAADEVGLESGKIEYAHVNGLPSSGCNPTSLMTANWTAVADPKATATLAGAMSWADSITWTIPDPTGPGYYCVRGSVTDAGGATTLAVNPYGIK